MKYQGTPTRLHSLPKGSGELGVSIPTLRRAIAANKLRTIKIGSRRLIPDDEIERVAREGLDLNKPRTIKIGSRRLIPDDELERVAREGLDLNKP